MNLKLASLGALFVIALSACSTVPVVHDPSGVDVTVTPLTQNQAKVYYGIGIPYNPNPFLPESGIVSQKYDYIVLRIQIAALHATTVGIVSANAVDSKGTIVARLYDRRSFTQITKDTYINEPNTVPALTLKIEQNYFPDNGVTMTKEGTATYAAVLVGKHPLAKNLNVEVEVQVGANVAPRIFHFTVNPIT